MAEERLHFTDFAGGYNAMLAAEHLVRYHCVRQLCRGKRVLDVACGEGYGSALLAEWGASEVVGVDISAEAIAATQKVFAHPNITFIQGDACRLQEVLGDVPAFDLIVSFETMEHVSDVPALLAGIRHYRVPEGTVAISCPNDYVEDAANPYHMRRYTFDEFCSTTTAVLGPASGWLLGTPAQGQMLYPAGESQMENSSDGRMALVTEYQELARSAAIPAQPNVAPTSGSCKFFLGYWGSRVDSDAVISPQSFAAFAEPWRALAWFKQQREELVNQCEELTAQRNELNAAKSQLDSRCDDLRIANAELQRQVADIRRRMLVQARIMRERLEHADAELARVKSDALGMRAELNHWVAFRQSRSYRLTRIYVRSYSMPVAGAVLRHLRRVAGLASRSVRVR